VPGALSSWWLTAASHQLTVWPTATSAALVAFNAGALWLGRRQVTAQLPEDGLSAEERQLMERLDPSYWVQHAAERGLSGTVTGAPTVGAAGIECAVRLDGEWTVKKLRAAADGVRALLGARTDLPMLVGAGARGGWGVIRLRTRSAAPDGAIEWRPGDAFGVDMVTGEDVRVPLGLRLLIAGMSGSGKSTASRPLLADASEGPTNALVIIDLKQVEGRLWDHRARVASTPEDVIALVDELADELTERLDVLPKGQATLIPTAARPRITVVVDEGAEVASACTKVPVVTGYTESGKAVVEKRDAMPGLDTIARMGRAACIDLWWMTQSPTYGDGVPRQIAKQLGTRIGLAVESPSEARVVFGESAQEKGWKADELPMPGVAMVRDGKRGPDPVKVRYMTDAQVIALPDQPIWRRADAAGERPALRLVKDAAPADAADAAPAIPAQAGPETNRDRVLQAVLDGARTGRDITDRTGLNKGTVSREIKSLIASGDLVKGADGMLTAPASAKEA
jgi:S-DNA-T family DNA segregation ATPase FtsK/SpoIIIE